MTSHKPKHFKPLKWEDTGDGSYMAKTKLPFELDYVVFPRNGDPRQNKVYNRTEMDFIHLPFFGSGDIFPTIPEAKAYAEQHYQNVMAKLEKAIEKLKIKRQ